MGQCRSPSVSPSRQAASSTGPAPEQLSLFQQYLQEGNPFEMPAEHREEETEDVLASNGVGDKKTISTGVSVRCAGVCYTVTQTAAETSTEGFMLIYWCSSPTV